MLENKYMTSPSTHESANMNKSLPSANAEVQMATDLMPGSANDSPDHSLTAGVPTITRSAPAAKSTISKEVVASFLTNLTAIHALDLKTYEGILETSGLNDYISRNGNAEDILADLETIKQEREALEQKREEVRRRSRALRE